MKLKPSEKTLPPVTFVELLNRAIQASGDPEGIARTLLATMVEAADECGGGVWAFAPFVQDETEVELHLVGGREAPHGGDSTVFSPDGNAGRSVAGFCRAGADSSRLHRSGIFSKEG